MTADEIQDLLQKLRERYSEYAKKYNRKWFDRDAFEERYKMSVSNRMDIQAFLVAEIANFETLCERYEKKKAEKESFSKKVDKIIEENYARVKKYEPIDFHPMAGIEIRHLYGAMSQLAQYYIPVFWLIITDYSMRNQINELEHSLQRICIPKGNRPPTAIEDHILLLGRPHVTEIEIEKNRNSYLKESAFMLYGIIAFCDSLVESRAPMLEVPIRFDKSFFTPEIKDMVYKNFSDCTGYGALLKIKELCEEILADFRLTAFKPAR